MDEWIVNDLAVKKEGILKPWKGLVDNELSTENEYIQTCVLLLLATVMDQTNVEHLS